MDRYMDYLAPCAMAVGFFATAPFGRKNWWLADSCASLTFGIGLILIPNSIVGFQISGGQLDELHLWICRCIGAILIGNAAFWFIARNTFDQRLYGSLLLAKVLGLTLFLLCQLNTYYHISKKKGMKFNDKFLTFGCLGVGLWLLGSIWQLFKHVEIGGYIHKPSFLHTGMFFDHFCLMVSAMMLFAFPNQILKFVLAPKTSIDSVHVALLRQVAAMLVTTSLSANAAPGFLYAKDKRSFVMGRLLTQALFFVVHIVGHLYFKLFSPYNNTPLLMVGFYNTFLLSMLFRSKDKEPTKPKDKDT